jgi:hypothetical protein
MCPSWARGWYGQSCIHAWTVSLLRVMSSTLTLGTWSLSVLDSVFLVLSSQMRKLTNPLSGFNSRDSVLGSPPPSLARHRSHLPSAPTSEPQLHLGLSGFPSSAWTHAYLCFKILSSLGSENSFSFLFFSFKLGFALKQIPFCIYGTFPCLTGKVQFMHQLCLPISSIT